MSHIQQTEISQRAMTIFRQKMEAKGFTFVGDVVTPPTGMGHFAVMDYQERFLQEALEEAAKPQIGLVEKE